MSSSDVMGLAGAYGADAVQQELVRMVEERAKAQLAQQMEAHRQAQVALQSRGLDQGDKRIGLQDRQVGLGERQAAYERERDAQGDAAADAKAQQIAGFIRGLPPHLQGAAQGSNLGINFKPEDFVNAPLTYEQQDARSRSNTKFETDEDIRQAREAEADRRRTATHTAGLRPQGQSNDAKAINEANEIEDSISLIDRMASDPALSTAVGFVDSQGLGKLRDPAGVTRFEGMHNQLVGRLELAQAGKLKGQGTITDKERDMLKGAATALRRALSEDDYKAELARIRTQFERMPRLSGAMGFGGAQINPGSMGSANTGANLGGGLDVDALLKKYGGG